MYGKELVTPVDNEKSLPTITLGFLEQLVLVIKRAKEKRKRSELLQIP